MGPRELLAAVEILSAEGRFPRKVVVKEGPDFKEIRHVGDETTILYARLGGKGYIVLRWIKSTPTPKFIFKDGNYLIISNGKYNYIQLTYEEAITLFA